MFDLPFSGSIAIYLVLGVLIASLIMLVVFIWRRVYRLFCRLRGRPVARVGIFGSTIKLLLILLLIAATAATLMLVGFLRSYTAFTHRKRVATVYCAPVPGAKDKMLLRLVIFNSPTRGQLGQYRLLGQQWAIEGDILKWEDWLNFLGLKTMYRLTRVRGRYLRSEDEAERPASAYDLTSRKEDSEWHWLYKYGDLLPFVQAVYGNTVFSFPSPTKRFEIYVTTSGLMIKEEKDG